MDGKDPTTPKWLETSIEKKRSMVPLLMLIDDLVSICLEKSLKDKKARTESKIKFDKSLGHWSAEIAKPPKGSLHEDLTPQYYQVSRIDLGKGSRVVDMKIFQASNKKISDRVWKDAQNK